MKKQTYIIVLEDQDGRTVDFERWTYKRAEKCVDTMVKLYGEYWYIYSRNLEQTARVVCYPTPDGYNEAPAVWTATKAEFIHLVEQYQERKKKRVAERLEALKNEVPA